MRRGIIAAFAAALAAASFAGAGAEALEPYPGAAGKPIRIWNYGYVYLGRGDAEFRLLADFEGFMDFGELQDLSSSVIYTNIGKFRYDCDFDLL
jgi:hypothetical protein